MLVSKLRKVNVSFKVIVDYGELIFISLALLIYNSIQFILPNSIFYIMLERAMNRNSKDVQSRFDCFIKFKGIKVFVILW